MGIACSYLELLRLEKGNKDFKMSIPSLRLEFFC